MSLFNFMDESSEMYMEARDEIAQLSRFIRKEEEENALKKDKAIERNLQKTKVHDAKNGNLADGKRADKVLRSLFGTKKSDLTPENVKSLARYTNASDSIEKHDKKLKKKRNIDESFSNFEKEVDYAPVNEPIKGDDFEDLPDEKEPDYVPSGYGKGSPKDNSTTESYFGNFDADLLL